MHVMGCTWKRGGEFYADCDACTNLREANLIDRLDHMKGQGPNWNDTHGRCPRCTSDEVSLVWLPIITNRSIRSAACGECGLLFWEDE